MSPFRQTLFRVALQVRCNGKREEEMPKCSQDLRDRIERSPSETVYLLLRVDEVGEERRTLIERAGFAVRSQTTLVPCFAVSGPGAGLRALLDELWLVRVEEDGHVRTLSG